MPCPLPFKKTCPCTILPPPFFYLQTLPPSGGGNQNLLPPSLKKKGGGGGSNYANLFCSFIIKFEQLGHFVFSIPLLISLRVASMNVSILQRLSFGAKFFVVDLLNIFSSSFVFQNRFYLS